MRIRAVRAWRVSLLLIFLGGCATTGAVRVPLSDCTTRCFGVSDRAQRFACMQSCPGASYSDSSCTAYEPRGAACISDPTHAEDKQAAAAVGLAIGVLDILLDTSSSHSNSCCCRH